MVLSSEYASRIRPYVQCCTHFCAARIRVNSTVVIRKARLEKLIAEFESSAKRGIDRSLAVKLRNELVESDPPYVSRATILQLAKWCKTNSPLYWDGMEVARKISQLLFGCVVDRDGLDV